MSLAVQYVFREAVPLGFPLKIGRPHFAPLRWFAAPLLSSRPLKTMKHQRREQVSAVADLIAGDEDPIVRTRHS